MKRKRCGDCRKELLIAEFGICRARKDGRNLYCKPCINHKVTEFRKRKRAMKVAIANARVKDEAAEPERKPYVVSAPLSTLQQVRNALQDGYLTRQAIRNKTGLYFDEIGDALAELTFVLQEARIVKVGDESEFHLIAGFVRIPVGAEMKVCRKCGEPKRLMEFYREERYADNRRPYCSDCEKQRYRRSRAA